MADSTFNQLEMRIGFIAVFVVALFFLAGIAIIMGSRRRKTVSRKEELGSDTTVSTEWLRKVRGATELPVGVPTSQVQVTAPVTPTQASLPRPPSETPSASPVTPPLMPPSGPSYPVAPPRSAPQRGGTVRRTPPVGPPTQPPATAPAGAPSPFPPPPARQPAATPPATPPAGPPRSLPQNPAPTAQASDSPEQQIAGTSATAGAQETDFQALLKSMGNPNGRMDPTRQFENWESEL